MLRVGIVGCGMVADQHVAQIHRVPDCRVVAACDLEPLMAEQLADRFEIEGRHTDLLNMLEEHHPDVVHITTPAQSHYSLGKKCLEAGCHIYMEKPFTVTVGETEEILSLAEERGLQVTVGHNLQFSPEAIRMRRLVDDGFLGGRPIHMDCTQAFTHEDTTYASALLGDSEHWVRKLPGSLVQNLISHGLAKIAEFLPGDDPDVIAHASTSPYLRKIGQTDIVDEVRAIIHDGDVTASFTFSTQLGAATNQLSLHGPKGSLMVDSTNRTLVRVPKGHKSYLRFFLTPRAFAREYRSNSWWNIAQFLKNDFHMNYSMRKLIGAFYDSVRGGANPPIPSSQILATARMMDRIFAQFPRRAGKGLGISRDRTPTAASS